MISLKEKNITNIYSTKSDIFDNIFTVLVEDKDYIMDGKVKELFDCLVKRKYHLI